MTAAVNGVLAALCCIGHAALMVAIINRIDGWRIRRPLLKLLTSLHHLSLVVYPGWILVVAVLHREALVSQSFWSLQPELARWYSLACLAMSAVVPMRMIQNLTRPRSAALREQSGQTIDIARDRGLSFDRHLVTRLPGNESLHVEFNTKHLRLARLPAAWNGLSLLHLSDTHFTGAIPREWFEAVCDLGRQSAPDLVVFTGDLLDRPELVKWLPDTLGALHAPLGCWFVLGNHDWYAADPQVLRERLTQQGWQDATEGPSVLEHRGEPLVLAGIETPWMGGRPDFSSVPPEAFRLLLSHTPDNLPWARTQGVDLMLAGHTHGGQIRLPLLGPVYCPNVYGPVYCDGVFLEPPTVLHVSRGLSGETPLRFRCPPELTRLVLHRDS